MIQPRARRTPAPFNPHTKRVKIRKEKSGREKTARKDSAKFTSSLHNAIAEIDEAGSRATNDNNDREKN